MLKRSLSILTVIILALMIGFAAPAGSADSGNRKIASVTGGVLKLRSKASTKGDVLGSYTSGTMVNVLAETDKTWSKVEVNGKTGYMMSKYLTAVTEYTHITWAEAKSDSGIVNLYDMPDGKIICKTPGPCLFEVTEKNGDWCKVRTGQQFYYIQADRLTETDEERAIATYMGSGNEYGTSVAAMNDSIHDVGSQKSLSASGEQLQCEIRYPVFILGRTDAAISEWVRGLIGMVSSDIAFWHPGEKGTLTVGYNTRKLDDTLTQAILYGEYAVGSVKMPIYKVYTIDMVNDMILSGGDLVKGSSRDKVLNQLKCKVMRLFGEYSGGYAVPVTDHAFDSACLDQNGLTFYFVPGELLPVSYGYQKITLPYLQSGEYLTADTPVVSENKRHIDPSRPMIALTFDDGPGDYTYMILDALETYGGRATFCVVGSRLSEYANVIKAIAAQENEIACHTWGHKKLINLSREGIKKQITQVNNLVKEIADYDITVLRPPYGSTNSNVRKVCADLGMTIAFWTIDTEDWITKNPDTTYERILEGAGTGVIVLCHDIYEETAEAAIRVIPELISRGYQLVTMSELLSFHKDGPVPGTVYKMVSPENIIADQD